MSELKLVREPVISNPEATLLANVAQAEEICPPESISPKVLKQLQKAGKQIRVATRADLVRRVPVTLKRNDLCPCGSGKKFKKCCWDMFTD